MFLQCSVCGRYVSSPCSELWLCPVCDKAIGTLAESMAQGSWLTRGAARARIESMLRNVHEEHQACHQSDQ